MRATYSSAHLAGRRRLMRSASHVRARARVNISCGTSKTNFAPEVIESVEEVLHVRGDVSDESFDYTQNAFQCDPSFIAVGLNKFPRCEAVFRRQLDETYCNIAVAVRQTTSCNRQGKREGRKKRNREGENSSERCEDHGCAVCCSAEGRMSSGRVVIPGKSQMVSTK